MKRKSLLFLAANALVFSTVSCGNPPIDNGEITVEIPSYMDSSYKYQLTFTLKDEVFEKDSSYYSKDVALIAYGNAIANDGKEKISKFYNDGKFDNVYLSSAYDSEPTDTSVGYAFGHRVLKGKDFIFVSIRGFNYGREWSDNFNLGLSGEHSGFAARADMVNVALKEYVSSHNYLKDNTALLINGYSRGGGIANLLAKRVTDEEEVAVATNIYAYTFEAPQGAPSRGVYDNIYNIVSSGDIIPCFAPSAYGLTRYGVDIEIYSENIDDLFLAFDENHPLPAFIPQDNLFSNDVELAEYVINQAVSYEQKDEEQPKQIKTREEFVNNYQPSITYALGLFFGLKQETIDSIVNTISQMGTLDLAAFLFDDNLYNFLNPFIKEDGIEYNEEELKAHCKIVVSFVAGGPGTTILPLAMNGSLNRMIYLHCPEVNYVLLKESSVMLY